MRIVQVLCTIALLVLLVESSHNRGGFISWQITGTRQVTFKLTHAWRVGAEDSIGVYFGDGSYTLIGHNHLIFSGYDLAGEAYSVFQETWVHTYTSDGPFTVYWESCCRIGSLVNAGGGSFRVQTIVDLRTGYDSPISSIPPLLQFPISSTGSYKISVADPNGLPYSCRLSTLAEAAIGAVPAIGTSQLSVSSGCIINWDTAAGVSGRKYAVSIAISQQGTSTAIPLDFIIELVPQAALPTCSVVGNSGLASVGKSWSVTIAGTSTAVSSLTVSALGLASTATLSPAVGSSGAVPFTVTLTDTPAAPGAYSSVIVFTDVYQRSVSCPVAYQVTETINCNSVKYDSCKISNGKTSYSLSAPSDADSFSWTSTCTGSFDDASDDDVEFQTTTNPNTPCVFSVVVTDAGVSATCNATATCPLCTASVPPPCAVDQEATYVVHDPASVDAYVNGDVLAVGIDLDGAIISATSSQLPPGVGLNSDGQFVVVNNALLESGSYNITVTTTDVYGGTTTQIVTIVLLDIVCGPGLASCGRACYNPDVHDCIIHNGKRHLCLNNQIICNINDQCCYDPTLQDCIAGQLCPKGYQLCNGGCYNPSTSQCFTTATGAQILCNTGFQECNGGCYDPAAQSCTHNVLCGVTEQYCAGGCISPVAWDCVDDVIVPKGNLRCGQTNYNPAAYACLNGHDLCPLGMKLCGNACYNPSAYTCQSNFQLIESGYEMCGSAPFKESDYECCDASISKLCRKGADCPCT